MIDIHADISDPKDPIVVGRRIGRHRIARDRTEPTESGNVLSLK
ncbi:hypothetical protein [Gordonia paraffinivorans]|nr:hypothetical protein [Gordonia paraffinivorans]